MRIGCSGQVSERSGIGVVQKQVYAYLSEAGHELVFSAPRDVGTSPVGKLHGLARGFRPARGPLSAYLSTVPPLPYEGSAPLLTIVHDLRWLRTRSKPARSYRAWDLRRTVQRSDSLLCISANTRRDLTMFDPRAAGKATVQLLGPGHVPDESFQESNSGLVMLVGGAAHKRNEAAAEALAIARPPWVSGVIGVGVSDRVRDTLSKVFPCEWFHRISEAEMLALYRRAEVFVMLGTDEGFGLPFVEALAAGCQVIATDHPLAREVVGAAGLLVTGTEPADIAKQLHVRPAIPAQVRADHGKGFSWKAFGEACEAELVRIAGRRQS